MQMKTAYDLPGSFGVPFLGEAHEAFIYKQQFYLKRYDTYKSYFKTKILNQKAVVLFGGDECNAVLSNKEEIFLSRKGWEILEEFLGYGILLQDGKDHKNSRKLIGSAFSELPREEIVNTIYKSFQNRLSLWEKSTLIFLYRELRKFTFDVIYNLVFDSKCNGREIDNLERQFSNLVDGQLDVFRIKTQHTAYGRALEARKEITNYVFEQVRLEHQKDKLPSGILGFIIKNNHKSFIFDTLDFDEITVQIIQILFAGYETSANFIYWAIYSLYKHPKILSDLKSKISDLDISKEPLKVVAILENYLLETERLFPPVYAIPRGLSRDFCINDFIIPKSWNIFVSPLITHRIENIFPNPNLFIPNRFRNSDLNKYKQLFGFGAGQHRCLGKEIAKLEASIFIGLLLQKSNFVIEPNLSFDQAISNSSAYLKRLFIKLS